MSRIVIPLLLLLVFGLTGCGRTDSPPKGSPAEKGSLLFTKLGCLGCHRLGGRGGTLEGVTIRRDEAWFESYLENPSLQRPDTMMPPYHIELGEKSALWSYLVFRDADRSLPLPRSQATNETPGR